MNAGTDTKNFADFHVADLSLADQGEGSDLMLIEVGPRAGGNCLPQVIQDLALTTHLGETMVGSWDWGGIAICAVLALAAVLTATPAVAASVELTLAGVVATRLFSAGGAGGIAFAAWVRPALRNWRRRSSSSAATYTSASTSSIVSVSEGGSSKQRTSSGGMDPACVALKP